MLYQLECECENEKSFSCFCMSLLNDISDRIKVIDFDSSRKLKSLEKNAIPIPRFDIILIFLFSILYVSVLRLFCRKFIGVFYKMLQESYHEKSGRSYFFAAYKNSEVPF